MHVRQKKKYTILFDNMRNKAPESLFYLSCRLKLTTWFKKRLWYTRFPPSEFTIFLRTHFLIGHLRWLLLWIQYNVQISERHTPWTRAINWMYRRRSEVTLNVFWTSYIRLIYSCFHGDKHYTVSWSLIVVTENCT